MLAFFIFSTLFGLLIGIFSGMLGIGGGTVLIPVFRLFFKMSPLMSAATSLFVIIPTSIAGVISHARQKTIHLPLGLILGLAGACTSPFGVHLASISPDWAIMLVAALVIGYSAFSMLKKAINMKPKGKIEIQKKLGEAGICAVEGGQEENDRSSSTLAHTVLGQNKKTSQDTARDTSQDAPQDELQDTVRLKGAKVAIAILIGLTAGLLSGYVGIGGGFIMVPLMILYINGISMKQASGTSLTAIVILATPGALKQALLGNISYMAGIAVGLGSIPGAFLGARLVKYVPERTLRFVFSIFLGIAAILLVGNEFFS